MDATVVFAGLNFCLLALVTVFAAFGWFVLVCRFDVFWF